MNYKNRVNFQKLIANTLSGYKKIAQHQAEMIATDINLLRAFFGAEGFIKLACAFSGKTAASLLKEQRKHRYQAPDKAMAEAFGKYFLDTLSPHVHELHFDTETGGEKEETFSKSVVDAAGEFYPMAYATALNLIPKKIAKKINAEYSPTKYTLYSGVPLYKNDVGEVHLDKGSSITEGVEALAEKGVLKEIRKYERINDKILDKVNGYSELDEKNKSKSGLTVGGDQYVLSNGMVVEKTVAADLSQSDIKFDPDRIQEKIQDMLIDMISYYNIGDPLRLKKLIVDSAFGKDREKKFREKGHKEKIERITESQEYFVPRIDAETRDKKLEELRKEQNLPKNAPPSQIDGADMVAENRVDMEVIDILEDEGEFTMKLKEAEVTGKAKKKLYFNIYGINGIKEDRIFTMEVPEKIGALPIGETYNVKVNPIPKNSKKLILDFVDFKKNLEEDRYETTKERGLDSDEIKKLVTKMTADYLDQKIRNVKLGEMVKEFSGQIVINGKEVYEPGDLASAVLSKDKPEILEKKDKWEEAAIKYHEEAEEAEQEAEEETKSFWEGDVYENLSNYILSQGSTKISPLIKTIASSYPDNVTKLSGPAIVFSKPFIQWAMKIISDEIDVGAKKVTAERIWAPIIMNQISSSKAFETEEFQSILEDIVKLMHGNNWETKLKAESMNVKQRGGDPDAYIKEKANEYANEAKKFILSKVNAIAAEVKYSARFILNIKEKMFKLIKNKNPYIMELFKRTLRPDTYRTILDKVYDLEKKEEEEKEKKEEEKEKKEEAKVQKMKPIEEKLKAIEQGNLDEEAKSLVQAIIAQNDDALRKFGIKLTDKGKANLDRYKYTDKEGNPIPFENLKKKPKDLIKGYLKKYYKKKAEQAEQAEQQKKMASILADATVKVAADFYEEILSGLNNMNPTGHYMIRNLVMNKRGY